MLSDSYYTSLACSHVPHRSRQLVICFLLSLYLLMGAWLMIGEPRFFERISNPIIVFVLVLGAFDFRYCLVEVICADGHSDGEVVYVIKIAE